MARTMHASLAMRTPVRVTFHGIPRSEAAEATVGRCLLRLEHLHVDLVHCHAWIDLSSHLGHTPRFRVRLSVGVPGAEITVSHESGHGEVFVAITDAFVAAGRQLQGRLQRGDIERHPS